MLVGQRSEHAQFNRCQEATSCSAASSFASNVSAAVSIATTVSSCLYVSIMSSSNRMGGSSCDCCFPTPCIRLKCCCRFPRRLKRAGQRSQAKGRSPVWMMTCRSSCERHFLSLPQMWQTKLWGALSPLACTTSRCLLRWLRRLKRRLQKSQAYGRTSLWISEWLSSRDLNLKTLQQTGQGKALVWDVLFLILPPPRAASHTLTLRWTRMWCCFSHVTLWKLRKQMLQRCGRSSVWTWE